MNRLPGTYTRVKHLTDDKLAALLMRCGPVPRGRQIPGIVMRSLQVFAVAGVAPPKQSPREIDGWMADLLHAIDLLYGPKTDHTLMYEIAMEYVEHARQRFPHKGEKP